MTIKILSEKFDKEIKHLKETVNNLANRLENSNTKIKALEDKLVQKQEDYEKLEEIEIVCKICKQIY